MKNIEFDMEQFREFFGDVKAAAKGEFQKEFELFLEELGNEFLRLLQDEIIRREVVDSRLLLASFGKGGEGNVWSIEDGGFTLEVGTNLKYASYVNDGHWTNKKGVARRWVPGDVVLNSDGKVVEFRYNPSASTGIILKQKWVEGKPYWDKALDTFNKKYPEILDSKLQQWMDSYFGD